MTTKKEFEKFHQHIIDTSKELLKKDKNLSTLFWFLKSDGETINCVPDFSTPQSKMASISLIKKIIKEEKVMATIQVGEVWVHKIKSNSEQKSYNSNNESVLQNFIKNNESKQEAIMIIYLDIDKNKTATSIPFIRQNSTISFKPEEDISHTIKGGLMFSLFD